MSKTKKVTKRRVSKGMCKYVREGVADEISGGAYYKNLLKKLKAAGASQSTIQAFKSSRKDEHKHHGRLVKLKRAICK